MVNRERKRKVEMNRGIGIEKWDRYFREMLKDLEGRVRGSKERRGERGGAVGEEEKEEELKEEEVRKAIKKLRKEKATGEDGIKNEVWLWGGEGLKKRWGRYVGGYEGGKNFQKDGKMG